MGANTLMVQSGAATSGGISFGAGSVMTLTPQDADEIARQCPAVSYVSPLVRARAQIVYGNRNWVPTFINGVAPTFLKVQEWEDFDEGEMFTDADVRNATRCASSARPSSANSSRASRPSARNSASRTSPSASSAC